MAVPPAKDLDAALRSIGVFPIERCGTSRSRSSWCPTWHDELLGRSDNALLRLSTFTGLGW